MPSRPCIAIVAASLDIVGGQGVQAHELVVALRGDGYTVAFIAIDRPFPRLLRWLRDIPYLRTLVNQLLYLPRLLDLSRVDVAHVFSASYASFLLAPLPAMLLARAMNKRVVLHYHSGEADDHFAHWGVLVHPWLKLAHEIVVPSEYLARVFAHYGHPVRVVPNVVDLSRFAYRRRRSIGPRLLSTRNLEAYYRVDVILEAFALVKAEQPDATLTVAGYGREEGRLKDLAVDGVRFVGKMEPSLMPALYASADIFLNASVVDNQPVSILEAMASGLSVVSTPAGDIPAMVQHRETGLLVAPNNPQSMAEAVLQLLAEPAAAERMADRARQQARRYSWQAVRDEWAAVYEGTPLASSARHGGDTHTWTESHTAH